GIFVLLRRWTAPKSAHFYVFCLVSFIFYAFKYTGKLNAFDWTIHWGNVIAGLLQAALFLHFAVTFPERKGIVNRYPWVTSLLYLPGILLLGFHVYAFYMLQATGRLRFTIDQIDSVYQTIFFVLAAVVLWHSYRHADTPILRQQLKLVTR